MTPTIVADHGNNRIQIFDQDGKYRDQWANSGTPYGLFITNDDIDESNRLFIANTNDGIMVDRIEGLFNPHAVTVDKRGVIYIAEIDGTNVKKFVKR